MLFNITNAIRRVQVNQDGLKFNGTHQLLFYADDVNILRRSIYAVKKTQIFISSSKETGLEVNSEKTKCMVTS